MNPYTGEIITIDGDKPVEQFTQPIDPANLTERALSDEEIAALEDFKRHMETVVVPEIVRAVEERQRAAAATARVVIRNEQEGHNAWRKRATEAEERIDYLTKQLAEQEHFREQLLDGLDDYLKCNDGETVISAAKRMRDERDHLQRQLAERDQQLAEARLCGVVTGARIEHGITESDACENERPCADHPDDLIAALLSRCNAAESDMIELDAALTVEREARMKAEDAIRRALGADLSKDDILRSALTERTKP